MLDEFAVAPPNFVQHFHPTIQFLDWWTEYVAGRFVIEVGAGCCHFTKAMHKRGIKALAIEPRANDEVRMECASFLLPTSVQRATLLQEIPAVVVAARPDHSGWISEVPFLINPESEFIYIGLPKNFDIDLGIDVACEVLGYEAGEDYEQVLRLR